MKSYRLVLPALILFLHPVCFGQGIPGQPKDEAFSENKKFSVEITETEINKPILSVFKRDGAASKMVWNRSLAPKEDENDPNAPTANSMLNEFKKTLSNDGTIVILRARYPSGDETAMRVLTQKGGDKIFNLEDFLALFADTIEDDSNNLPMNESVLELLLENEKPPLYALWLPLVGKWSVLNLDKQELALPDAPLAKRLDALGLAKAREIVRVDQPDALKKMLNPLKRKAKQIVPGIMPEQDDSDSFDEKAQAAYRFLAAQKNPEDKKYIEGLLQAKMPSMQTSISYWNGGMPFELGLYSPERGLGDELLAKWEGKTNSNEDFEQTPGGYGPSSNLRYLSRIAGSVNFPFAAPEKSGSVWIYLIPASLPEKGWEKDSSVSKLSFKLENQKFGTAPSFGPSPQEAEEVLIDRFPFYFDTISPGEYRLKAIWDKRPPYAPFEPEAAGGASPGDYESAESKVIKVAAGEKVKDLKLDCTNRVGNAEEYYAADDLWKAQHPAGQGEPLESQERFFRGNEEKILFSAPIADWVIRTNENKGGLELRRIRLIETTDLPEEKRTKKLAIRFVAPPAKKKKQQERYYESRLVDEHGCRFNTHQSSSSGRSSEIFFSIIPYSSKELKLQIFQQDMGEDVDHPRHTGPKETLAASFVLTNLLEATPLQWTADPSPAKHDLDLVTVELSVLDPSAHEFPAGYGNGFQGEFGFDYGGGGFGQRPKIYENKYTFFKDGKQVSGWHELSGKFVDRWGNESSNVKDFCKMEEILKLSAQFARDPEKGSFTPDEKWEIPVPKVPGPGESIALNLTNQIQGLSFQLYVLGGTGEFTYKRGQLISATNEISGVDSTPRFSMPQFPGRARPVEPKLYFKQDGQGPNPFMWAAQGRRRPNGGVLAAKIPHLACRLPSDSNEIVFALLEQDTSVLEPHDAMLQRHGPFFEASYGSFGRSSPGIKFLPLDFRSGDKDRKLTFIVQKLRNADFFVTVPKNVRNRSEERE